MKKNLVTAVSFFIVFGLNAQKLQNHDDFEREHATSRDATIEVVLGVGLSLPPYVFPENDSGIEYDIVKESFAISGYHVTPKYLPLARIEKEIQVGKVAGVLTINEGSGVPGLYYSDSHVTYQNVAVSLKSRNLCIEKVADLREHKVIGFQNATKYLGKDYKTLMEGNAKYREFADQLTQINLLFKGRAELVVMDINIFKYYRNVATNVDTSAEVVIHDIFAPTLYKVGFSSADLRNDFNKGLAYLKKSGRYDQIIDSFIE